MKKIFSVFTLILSLILLNIMPVNAEINKQINANIKTKRVPEGTIITLKLLDPINSSMRELGDSFDLMVVDNIKVDNVVVIPKGSVVRGSIEEVTAPKMLYKGGIVRLYFDHIVSPTGKQVTFSAGLCNNKNITYDGALSSKTNYATAMNKTAEKTKNIVKTPVNWAWEKGDNVLSGAPKYVLAPLTAVVSAPVAGIYFVGDSIVNIFRKGEDLNMNQGETIQVQLLKPIDMPVY